MTRLRLASALAVLCGGLFGQSFEVASIKPQEGGMPWSGVKITNNRLETYSTVLGLVMFASNVKNDQVARSPALATAGDQFYHLEAKASGEAIPSREDFRHMVQALLADRFKLASHREMRETPVYELVVAKGGPKFKEAAAGTSTTAHFGGSGRNSEFHLPNTTMAGLVDALDNFGFVGRHVVEKTGLTGSYEINLTFTPSYRMESETVLGDISILDALQDQLGLKLQPAKGMIETIVIDHVEKPTGN